MKKTYINPAVEIIEVEPQQMLATSILEGEYTDETILSRDLELEEAF